MTTDLLHGIALAIMATTQAVQVYLMHRAYRRLWKLEADIANVEGRVDVEAAVLTGTRRLVSTIDAELQQVRDRERT